MIIIDALILHLCMIFFSPENNMDVLAVCNSSCKNEHIDFKKKIVIFLPLFYDPFQFIMNFLLEVLNQMISYSFK